MKAISAQCDKCGGTLRPTAVINYDAGPPYGIIPTAYFRRCDRCGVERIGTREKKRWSRLSANK